MNNLLELDERGISRYPSMVLCSLPGLNRTGINETEITVDETVDIRQFDSAPGMPWQMMSDPTQMINSFAIGQSVNTLRSKDVKTAFKVGTIPSIFHNHFGRFSTIVSESLRGLPVRGELLHREPRGLCPRAGRDK